MNSVSKAVYALGIANVLVLTTIGCLHLYHQPPFLENKNNTMLFSRGVAYTSDRIESYQEFYTVDHKWHGFHDLHATIQPDGGAKSLTVYYSLYFWGEDIFSSRGSQYNPYNPYSKEYIPLIEPYTTEAHLIDEQIEQFFQTLYQDEYSFCFTSLLTSSVQCITADQ